MVPPVVTDSIDHKIRKGQIICKFSNYWHLTGSSMRITLSNYYVNNMSVNVDSIKMVHTALQWILFQTLFIMVSVQVRAGSYGGNVTVF